MTSREEIERLLNQTGRTLEGLPNSYSVQEVDNRFEGIIGDWRFGDFVLHQSDVIELLIGALRDALAEREAAIKDIPRACGYCKHWNDSPMIENSEHGTLVVYCEKECHNISGVNTGWEWRGGEEECQST